MFDNLDYGYYFLHVRGPDGPDVLLVRYVDRTRTVTIFNDGDSECQPSQNGDEMWVHKWIVYKVEPVVWPTADIPFL